VAVQCTRVGRRGPLFAGIQHHSQVYILGLQLATKYIRKNGHEADL